jgi:hypothetical protein
MSWAVKASVIRLSLPTDAVGVDSRRRARHRSDMPDGNPEVSHNDTEGVADLVELSSVIGVEAAAGPDDNGHYGVGSVTPAQQFPRSDPSAVAVTKLCTERLAREGS